MKTISNTQHLTAKAFKNLWYIRRLKEIGCNQDELVEAVKQRVLPICEQGLAWWAPLITKNESQMLERVLKTCMHIVFGKNYRSYEESLEQAGIKSLEQRRKCLFYKVARKVYNNPRYRGWFLDSSPVTPTSNTRSIKTQPALRPVTTRTYRYRTSAIPVMTSLLSWHPPLVYNAPKMY